MTRWPMYGDNERSPARRKMLSEFGIKARNARLATMHSAIDGTLLNGINQYPGAHSKPSQYCGILSSRHPAQRHRPQNAPEVSRFKKRAALLAFEASKPFDTHTHDTQ
eukprot:8426039-Pyramimonas_sp.AAC.1